jgi:polysaccharide deacetylase 2 family uncharacterized protein YibQ
MAVQPKKNKSTAKSKPITRKKPATKKATVKPRKRKSTKKNHIKKNILTILAVFMMITFVVFGYYLGKNSDEVSATIDSGEIESAYTTKELLKELSKLKAKHIKERQVSKEKKKVTPQNLPKPKVKRVEEIRHKQVSVKKETNKKTTIKTSTIRKTTLAYKSRKPKLAIVIDDVSKQSQINAIQATGVTMTPSIFPPSELSMTSHRLAKGLTHYMIHLPMESGSKQFNSQYKTLLTTFNDKKIIARVQELRQLFPHARYINNHTGSVYTNSYAPMYKLYKALRKEGFVFVDSRTIGSSKVRKIAHEFGDAYVARDIFIDNKHTVKYIHKQLAQAVVIAKKKGYAVAIGHPHKITMQALASANDILKDVELVYIDEIYKRK